MVIFGHWSLCNYRIVHICNLCSIVSWSTVTGFFNFFTSTQSCNLCPTLPDLRPCSSMVRAIDVLETQMILLFLITMLHFVYIYIYIYIQTVTFILPSQSVQRNGQLEHLTGHQTVDRLYTYVALWLEHLTCHLGSVVRGPDSAIHWIAIFFNIRKISR